MAEELRLGAKFERLFDILDAPPYHHCLELATP